MGNSLSQKNFCPEGKSRRVDAGGGTCEKTRPPHVEILFDSLKFKFFLEVVESNLWVNETNELRENFEMVKNVFLLFLWGKVFWIGIGWK